MIRRLFHIHIAFLIFALCIESRAQNCGGLTADAGPDMFVCDRQTPIQLQGDASGNVTKYYWLPSVGLSNPNILNPTVTAGPGRYRYTLTVEGQSNTNLVRNGDFEAGFTGFTTEYIYGVPGSPFAPDWISVGTNPQAYNGGFSPCGDHTSGSGNQLIVDGSVTAGKRIWCQTITLTPGTMYLFQFFVQSVYPVAPARLDVTVNGMSIGGINAGAVCDFRMFEACFTALSASNVICIRELSGIGFGNDFAIDDIALFEKCIVTDEVEVEIVDLNIFLKVPNPPQCASDVFTLDATGSSTGPRITLRWSTIGGRIIGQNGLKATAIGAGTYKLTLIYDNGFAHCEKEFEEVIDPADDLAGTVQIDGIATCSNDSVELSVSVANGSGVFNYIWTPPLKILSGQGTTKVKVTESGKYIVTVIDRVSGCEVQIEEFVIGDTTIPKTQLKGDTLLDCDTKNILISSLNKDTSKYTFTWKYPDGSTIGNKIELIATKPGNYFLELADKGNLCLDSFSFVISQDTIKPALNLGNDLYIDCIQQEVMPNIIHNPGGQNLSYYWTIGTIPLLKENSLLNRNIQTSGPVILRILNERNACEVSDTLQVFDIRKLPEAIAGIGGVLNCFTSTIDLMGSGISMDSAMVNWSTRLGNIISGANTYTPKIDQPGWYILRVEDTSNHCVSFDSVIIIEDFEKPDAVLGNDLTFNCLDSIILIDGSLSSTGPFLSFQWNTLDGIIKSGQGTPQIQVSTAGRYELIILNIDNGCSDTASILITPDTKSPIAFAKALDTLDCVTNKISLEGIAQSQTGNSLRYFWTSSAGSSIVNPDSLTPSVSVPGEYIFWVIDESNGCSTSVKAFVYIDTLPPVALA
ncbi:MAG: hypothetical protein M3Q56_12375, partial [Bacteroidota bacterium]|nr:hypothetical protein [Bacteroidota bacterium]